MSKRALTFGHSIPQLLFFIVLCLVSSLSTANAERIRSFDAEVRLQKNTALDVVETIVMDFENAKRHGIIRNIPVRYDRYNNAYTVRLKVLRVDNDKGQRWDYETSRSGRDLTIKIGDANKTLSGVQTYRIHYRVRRAVNFFKGAPEVYWNATGNEWDFPIAQASVRFYPPPGVEIGQIKTTSFRGKYGSTQQAQSQPQEDHIVFKTSNLKPKSGLTFVAGLPKGSVVPPSTAQNLLWLLGDWWPAFLLPILGGGILFSLYWKNGRDIDGGQAVAVEWSPPEELTPAEVGTLVDEHCDMPDIVSTLVDLAVRGYLIIEESETEKLLFLTSTDYTFIKRPDAPSEAELLPFERQFLQGIFGSGERTTLAELKNKFYQHLPGIKSAIYRSLLDKHLFTTNPETTRTTYVVLGIIIAAGGGFLWASAGSAWGIGMIITGLIFFLSARAMPAKTARGSKMLRQCLGFQRFIELAEKDRIRVLADKDPTVFGRMLPYAIVLGVADQWADAFKDLITEAPDWYIGPTGAQGFTTYLLVNQLGRGMNSMGNVLSSAPKSTAGSGGSGFSGGGSGGGFGGGGGSSW